MADDATVTKLDKDSAAKDDFDFDAYLAQREEATGKPADQSSFRHFGQTWTFTNPNYAPQTFADKLEDLENDDDATVTDVAEHFMGTDQLDRYLTAGGSTMTAMSAVRMTMESERKKTSDVDGKGRPTRPNRSSRRRQKK